MAGIFILRDGQLVEMMEQSYLAESELQSYLAAHPELLSAEAVKDERRRWLLVRREIGIADREGGSDRWSLDHLFVDQDAIPTLVEVKRSSDTRLRREVVGQMLDYAANAASYWDAGTLRGAFEQRFADPASAESELVDFLDEEMGVDDFWDAVAANLRDRQLRLIFVADHIPRELRSIVEFLNEQLKQTSVIAVEIKQYAEPGGDRINIVPTIIGDTEMARRIKDPSGRGPRPPRATEDQFVQAIEAAYPQDIATRVLDLYRFAKHHSTRCKFGRGTPPNASLWLGENSDPAVANPLSLAFWADSSGVAVTTKHFRHRREPKEMERLVGILRQLRGTSEALDAAIAKDFATFCTFPAAEILATDADLEAFKAALIDATKPPERALPVHE